MLQSLRLRERYALQLAVLVTVVVIAVATMLLLQFRAASGSIHGASAQAMSAALRNQVERRGRSVVAVIARAIVAPLYNDDLATLFRITGAARALSDVIDIRIYDGAGEVIHDGTRTLLAYGRPAPAALREKVLDGGGWLIQEGTGSATVAGPVLIGSRILGAVEIIFNLDEIAADTAQLEQQLADISAEGEHRILKAAVLLTIGLSMIGVVVGWWMARRLSRPIESFAAASRRIGAGDYTVALDWRSRDELGALADALRRMMSDLASKTVSKKFLDDILASMFDGLLVLGPDGRIVKANAAASRLTLSPIGDLVGQPITRFVAPPGAAGETAFAPSLLTRVDTLFRPDGSSLPVRFSSATMPSESGTDTRTVCVFNDLTDLKQAEAERSQLQEQLSLAQKMEAVGRLAGGIAHDFNNILGSILGNAHFLVEDLAPDTEQHGFACQIVKAGERATNLVQQILAFSRNQGVGQKPVDAKALVAETVDLLRATLPAWIALDLELPAEDLTVSGNQTQLIQVLMNLCVNARDAIGNRQGRIAISAAVMGAETAVVPEGGSPTRVTAGALVPGRRYLRLAVADDGSGMNRAVMERMFEPFFTTKELGKGTGLGLSAVHGIIAAHRGAMVVESAPGRGTRFELFLPLLEAPAAIAGEQGSAVTGENGYVAG